MSYQVFGVGNAIMDLQVQVDDAFLQQLGVEKGMMSLVDEARQQEILALLSDHQLHYCSGGSAANTIVGVADFGGTAAYACQTGDDQFGSMYVAEMRELGIDCMIPSLAGTTGSCVVLITPDAQRTMLTCLGVSAQLTAQQLDEEAIAKADYVYIEGYLFTGEATKEAALQAIRLAKKHDVRVALTISDPFVIGLCGDLFLELIESSVDLLFCNEAEAKALTGQDDVIDCAHVLHKHCKNVALTLGVNGSIIMHDGEAIAIESQPVQAIDTTGAGDMYAAGVLYGICNGFSWQQAGHLGSHAAARVVAQLGARLGQRFSKQDIVALLA